MPDMAANQATGLGWQVGVWDRMTQLYEREMDVRFTPVIDHIMVRSALRPDHRVLDVGTGTGSVALRTAPLVPRGQVIGIDISPAMLQIARGRASAAGLDNVSFVEGRAEELPFDGGSADRVFASLSLMYALDRAAVAHELARVLRAGGRLVAAFWSGPDRNDIVRFQTMAGSFAPEPPVAGVGPGSMADGAAFVAMLEDAGIAATLEAVETGFAFDTFEQAWDVLVGVTTANMDPARQDDAKAAVREAMWPGDGGPRYFSNLTQYVVGEAT